MRKLILILRLFIAVCLAANIPVYISAQSPMFKLIAKKAGCTPDTDAQKFIDSLSLTGTNATAICNLVKDLKDSSLWSSLSVIYPMIGGTSSTTAFNLKDPTVYKITWGGTLTYASTGVLPNGTTGYGNTGYNASLLTTNSSHFSVYLRTNTGVTNAADIGVFDGGTNLLSIYARSAANSLYADQYSFSAGGRITVTGITDSKFYFISSRTSSTAFNVYKNGTSIGSLTSAVAGSTFAQPFYIGAMNLNGTAGQFTNREIAFVTIGLGLTAAQSSTLNTIVERYNDALSRGVQ